MTKPNQSACTEAIFRSRRRLKKLEREIDNATALLEVGEWQEAYDMLLDAVDTSERLALMVRSIPAYTGHPRVLKDTLETISDAVPVEMGFTDQGWFSMRIPMLLPKKEKGSGCYIRGFLYPAMEAFFMPKPPVRYPDCVLVYRHVYDRDRPERQYRDHDNIELNVVTDAVALFVMVDDGPMRCQHYYTSAASSKERTEVYVIPRMDFPTFLKMEETIPDKGVILHENRPTVAKNPM